MWTYSKILNACMGTINYIGVLVMLGLFFTVPTLLFSQIIIVCNVLTGVPPLNLDAVVGVLEARRERAQRVQVRASGGGGGCHAAHLGVGGQRRTALARRAR